MTDHITHDQAARVLGTFQYINFWATVHHGLERTEMRVNGESTNIRLFSPITWDTTTKFEVVYTDIESGEYVGCTLDMEGRVIAVSGSSKQAVRQFEMFLSKQ